MLARLFIFWFLLASQTLFAHAQVIEGDSKTENKNTATNTQTNDLEPINFPTDPLDGVCNRLLHHANANALPPAYFARLIWTESRFDPNAISPKGALGIAQFIPSTAKLRGLDDPFNLDEAMGASAAYLFELKTRFGNLGYAAVAYNAGEGALSQWLAGKRTYLPLETLEYVFRITGHSVEDWRKPDFKEPEWKLDRNLSFMEACRKFPSRRSPRVPGFEGATMQAWGVNLAANFSQARALSSFKRLQKKHPTILGKIRPVVVRKVNRRMGSRPRYNVQLGADSRKDADRTCAALRREGGSCVVLKNR